MFQKPNIDHEISRSEGGGAMPEMHQHDYYELYYLEAGSREYFVEDSIFSVKAGDFVLVAPGKLHRTGGDYGMRTLVCFTQGFLQTYFRPELAQDLTQCFSAVRIRPEGQQEACTKLLRQLFASQEDAAFALTLASLLKLLGQCGSVPSQEDPISRIVAYINGNFATLENIGQIADAFYISKFHLCRIFKAAMKMTVVDYLNRVRIQNACRYLRSSTKTQAQIAQLCGFHDSAYFGNVFKKLMGTTPGAYRKLG